uniref:Uncharacterized protein n=1 Tax=Caenorhabditis tropicalis TaxID=1561998 RepID=A0A1I7UII2_9PELO
MQQNRRPPRPSPNSRNNNNYTRGPLRRYPKVSQALSLPTVPSEDGKDDELITPVQSQDFDFREVQHRYLLALQNEEDERDADGTIS